MAYIRHTYLLSGSFIFAALQNTTSARASVWMAVVVGLLTQPLQTTSFSMVAGWKLAFLSRMINLAIEDPRSLGVLVSGTRNTFFAGQDRRVSFVCIADRYLETFDDSERFGPKRIWHSYASWLSHSEMDYKCRFARIARCSAVVNRSALILNIFCSWRLSTWLVRNSKLLIPFALR